MEEQTGIKASFTQRKLKALLDKAHGAVGRMYPYFLLEFYLVRVTCSATDLKVGIVAEQGTDKDVQVDMGGKLCVPASKFRDLVGKFPDESLIHLTGLDNLRLRIDCDDYTGVIACVDPEQHFPPMELPMGDMDFFCYGELLQTIHGACAHAIDEAEGKTNSLYLRAEKGILLGVATDGHRLSLSAKAIDAGEGKGFDKGVIISSKVLSKIGLLSPSFCEIRVRENIMSFEQDRFSLIGQIREGEYPAFRKVIPTDLPNCCVVNAGKLAAIVERVRILAESDSVVLDIKAGADDDGDIQVSTENTAGVAHDLVSAEIKGEPAQIRLTPRYLVESLRSLTKDSKDVVIKYGTGKDPVVLIPADHSGWDERLELIMPRGR